MCFTSEKNVLYNDGNDDWHFEVGYTINEDLIKQCPYSIMEDSKGALWLSSNAGLFSYSNNRLIDVSDKVGIQTNFVNEVFEDKKGELWISTKKDLFHLKANELTNVTKDKIEVGKGIGSIAQDKKGNIWFTSNLHDLYIYDGKDIIEYQKSENNKGPVIF